MKEENFLTATVARNTEFFEKNSREPLCLITLCYLDKKRQYSHQQKYFSSKQIVKGSYEFGNLGESSKFLKIDCVLCWLAEKNWIEKNNSINGNHPCYRISDSGKNLIAYLKQVPENK